MKKLFVCNMANISVQTLHNVTSDYESTSVCENVICRFRQTRCPGILANTHITAMVSSQDLHTKRIWQYVEQCSAHISQQLLLLLPLLLLLHCLKKNFLLKDARWTTLLSVWNKLSANHIVDPVCFKRSISRLISFICVVYVDIVTSRPVVYGRHLWVARYRSSLSSWCPARQFAGAEECTVWHWFCVYS